MRVLPLIACRAYGERVRWMHDRKKNWLIELLVQDREQVLSEVVRIAPPEWDLHSKVVNNQSLLMAESARNLRVYIPLPLPLPAPPLRERALPFFPPPQNPDVGRRVDGRRGRDA